MRRLADGTRWAEGPVYVPDEDALVWSDIPNDRVLRWSGKDGSVVDLYRPADFANGHTLDHDGTILACEHGMRRVARYERDGRRTTVVDRYEGKRLNSPNDVIVASDGAIWFTDPPYGILSDAEGHTAESELGACYVFRFDRDSGELAIVSDHMVDPNGLAFSPDESVLYVSDTSRARLEGGNHHILAFDVTRRRPPARRSARLRGRSSPECRTVSGSTSRATSGRRPGMGSTCWTPRAPSSAGSCCPSQSAIAPSAAPMVGGSS